MNVCLNRLISVVFAYMMIPDGVKASCGTAFWLFDTCDQVLSFATMSPLTSSIVVVS